MATAVSLLIVGGVFFVSNTTQPPRAVSELGNYILVDHALSRAERGLLESSRRRVRQTRRSSRARSSLDQDIGQPSAANSPLEVADDVDEAALARVMHDVPWGAGVLAGAAVALLVIGYLLIYLLVFIPRGTVG